MITLSVITAMLSLIGVMFGYIAVAQKKAESKGALIQSNLILTDVKSILDRLLVGKNPSKSRLQILYSIHLCINWETGLLFTV